MKEKIKAFFKRNKWILLTLVLSSLVVSIIYTLQKIAPFGKNSMLDVDFYHQYGPLLNELYDRVKQGETLLYSFNTGTGIPFYRNFLNYLSSPFNLILFFFKKENIVMAFSIIIGLKTIFASVFMAYYLKKTFKKDGALITVFGLLYAFSGYFCAYYWNIMWLDGMVFLPLIMLGINKIVDEQKSYTYVISLAIMLFANYFIGYMICIFSVLYFLGYFWYRNDFKLKNIIKKFAMFAFSSVLAAGLMAVFLLPLFHSLSSISATGGTFPNFESSFSVFDYLFNHFTGTNRTVFASDILPLPNVYPGMLCLVLILLLFFTKSINWRFKLISLASIVFFFFSFNLTTIDYAWHAFHVPNDLPWRYSFIYVFVLITISYYVFTKIKEVSIFKISISFASLFILVLIASKTGFENLSDSKIITCLIILFMYYVTMVLIKNDKIDRKPVRFMLLAITMFECVYGIDCNWVIDHDIKTFMSDKVPYTYLIDEIKKDDNGLYRIEKTDYLTLNDGAWYDYYGVSTFTSMAYEDVAKFQRMMGMAGNDINSYYYQGYQTPVYNTMFNVKYLLGDYVQNDFYVPINVKDDHNAIGYNYSSSIAYAVNNEVKDFELESYAPFLNQSNFVTLSTGVNDVFLPCKVKSVSNGSIINESFLEKPNGEFNYHVTPGSKEFVITLDNVINKNVYLYVGGDKVQSFYANDNYYSVTSDEYYIIDTGKIDDEELEVKINLEDDGDGILRFYAYTLNDKAFNKFYDEISDELLDVTRYSDTVIEGNVNVNEDKLMFTTISYDDGWMVYVDGKEVKTKKIAKSYMGFDIEKGSHDIKLVYYPKGMREGLIISVVSLIIMMGYGVYDQVTNTKINKKDEFIV